MNFTGFKKGGVISCRFSSTVRQRVYFYVENDANIGEIDNAILAKPRFDALRLLVTISQTGKFKKKNILEKLQWKFKDRIQYCCIAEEEHENKGVHCHIFIEFTRIGKFHYKSFDFLFDKHANIQIVRARLEDRLRVWRYVRKVQNFIEFGKKSFEESQEKIGKNIRSYVTKMIMEGITINQLLDHEVIEIREYVLNNIRQVKLMIYEYSNHINLKQLEAKNGIEEIELIGLNDGCKKIAEKINDSIRWKWDRKFKSLNLHIWSRVPNMGKSSLVAKLMQNCSYYIFPPDGWFTRYNNFSYQFIIWDEVSFDGLKPTFLNLFFEGSKCQLPLKGDLSHKWDNPLVIMLSNKPIKEHLRYLKNEVDRKIYQKTLGARIIEIEVKEPIFSFIERIKPKIIKENFVSGKNRN